jgi:hypothetical protein
MIDLSNQKEDCSILFYTPHEQDKDVVDSYLAFENFSKYGIPASNFHFFLHDKVSDGLRKVAISSDIDSSNFNKPEEYGAVVSQINSRHTLLLIAGHGSLDGIMNPQNSDIYKPLEFLSPLTTNSNLETIILVVGVCEAGIFNFLNTRVENKNICILGATGLHNSLNEPVVDPYVANSFLMHFSNWFTHDVNLRDIDGDSKSTLMDAFKYAGSKTTSAIGKLRGSWYKEIDKHMKRFMTESLSEPQAKAIEDIIDKIRTLIHTHQEPWCLNANRMRDIIL